jgi:hypothetical protein
LFELKPKEFSMVIVEPAGAYIYQVQERKLVPLSEVKQQIETTVTNERLRQVMDGLMAGVKPEVNQAYFGPMAGPSPGAVGVQGPMARPNAGALPTPQQKRTQPGSPAPKSTPSAVAKPK